MGPAVLSKVDDFATFKKSVGKLREADEKYRRIIFTHDMTAEDRDEYKRLVTEAKTKKRTRFRGNISTG